MSDFKNICEAAAATGSLPAQMYLIREVDEADMLRKMRELLKELDKNNFIYRAQVVQSGWVCPKCGAVNAPFVPRCSCVPPRITCYNT